MRSHQTFQDENLKQAMMTAAEKANNIQIHVQVIKRNIFLNCYERKNLDKILILSGIILLLL